MALDALRRRLAAGGVVLLDGATGTELQRRGVPMHERAWSAAAVFTHPGTVREVHEDYVRAGSDVIVTLAPQYSSARCTLSKLPKP